MLPLPQAFRTVLEQRSEEVFYHASWAGLNFYGNRHTGSEVNLRFFNLYG